MRSVNLSPKGLGLVSTVAPDPLVGALLANRYRIERQIGQGGMGSVYQAKDLHLNDKLVAVKVIAHDPIADPVDTQDRFLREADVMSKLDDPHIVQITDFGFTPARLPFLVMELLKGETLSDRLRQGSLGSADTVLIVEQVASALMAADEKGVVHRDLKPANVFLQKAAGGSHHVKVLDFGLSKFTSASANLTRTKVVLGTPNYMSPEQAQGLNDQVDARTDQWALACIAGECLTGEMMFPGTEPIAVCYSIVHGQTRSLLGQVPGLHPDVEAVILRALAKDRSSRFPNVQDFAAAFKSAMARTAPTVPRTLRRTPPAFADSPTPREPKSPVPTARLSGPALSFAGSAPSTPSPMPPAPTGKTPKLSRLTPIRIGAVVALVAIGGFVTAYLLSRPPPSPPPPPPTITETITDTSNVGDLYGSRVPTPLPVVVQPTSSATGKTDSTSSPASSPGKIGRPKKLPREPWRTPPELPK